METAGSQWGKFWGTWQVGSSVFLVWNMTDVDTQQGLLSLGVRVVGSSARQEKEAEGTWEGVKNVETSTPGLPHPLLFVRCPSLLGLELEYVLGGELRTERGAGSRPVLSACFLLSLSQSISLSSLCPAFTVCPSVCLWEGRERESLCPRFWASILGKEPCD